MRGLIRDISADLHLDTAARHRGWFDTQMAAQLIDKQDLGPSPNVYAHLRLMTEVGSEGWFVSYVGGAFMW